MENQYLWIVVRLAVVLVLTVDAIVTTLLLSGAGFLSKDLSCFVGRFCMSRVHSTSQ